MCTDPSFGGFVVGRTKQLVGTLLVAVSLAACGPSASLQRDWGVYRVEATRGDLETVRSRFDDGARSLAYSPELRAWARGEAAAVQARLQEGDFRVGDRVVLSVERVPSLADTFIVTPDRALELPSVGEVPLTGVLRSELDDYLTEQIGRFVNDPVVRATSYLRISIMGEVVQPGYHLFPPETPVSEAIMLAGGPTANGRLSKVRVDRGNEWILRGDSLQVALGQGLTLAELRMHSGDEILVPSQPAFSPQNATRTLLVISGLIFAISRISR